MLPRKQYNKLLTHSNSFLNGPGGGIILCLSAFFTFFVLSPIFIPKIPKQPNIKDITLIITNNSADYMNALKNSGFRNIHVISTESIPHAENLFTSVKLEQNINLYSLKDSISTSYVLLSGKGFQNIPSNLPIFPPKTQLIGYSFSKCYERGYAVELPDTIDGALLSKTAFNRFVNFLFSHQFKNIDDAFRVFCDFHSLHLLLFPCGKPIRFLPKWEKIEVIESDKPFPKTQLDSIPLIPEVWRIQDLL